MNFGILDPRPIDEAKAHNASLLGEKTLGIEVTKPDLARQCGLGNIDPQHTDGDVEKAAIEVALTQPLPECTATLVTIRADLDSIGGMAVMSIRTDYEWACQCDCNSPVGNYCFYGSPPFNGDSDPMIKRLNKVANSDKFNRGDYSGPRPLPSSDNPWPDENASASDVQELAAIAAAISDFRVSPEERVKIMANWLIFGKDPEDYRERVEKERSELIKTLEDGDINHRVDGKVAIIETTHRAATMIGYCLAPIVIALNPEFRLGKGDPHKKFTVCQYTPNYVDLRAVFSELSQIEPGWGGSPTIGGSPQGESSQSTINQVVEVVKRHLK